MRKFLLFLLLNLAFLSNLYAQESKVTIQKGRLVFKLKPDYRLAIFNNKVQNKNLIQILQEIGASAPIQKFPKAYLPEGNQEAVDLTLIYGLTLNPKTDFQKVHQQLMQTGMFSYVEQLRNYEPLYQTNDPKADSIATITTHQYHLKRIRAYRGWDFEKGDTSVVIGILDTGILYTHKDLKDNIKKNYADHIDGIDNDNDGFIDNFRGWDPADNDNDATANATYLGGQAAHGVAVAGVASATTDNGKMVAGVGFKSKFLPIKIYPSTPGGHFAGYEGVVYAADHGCSIINLSWGGYATPSAFELDVITYAAINRNTVVVSAAGNTNGKLNFYPSTYPNVLSVGGLRLQNNQGNTFTYGYGLDITAPGEQIVTTWANHDSSTVASGGSSMACPMVAGTAALVKRKFPQYNAQQIMEQIRTTANDFIYGLPVNANLTDQLGKGMLDVARALGTTNAKSVRFMNIQTNKPNQVFPSDTVELIVDFKNFLAPLTNLAVSISATSSYITVLQGNYTAGAMATLATKTNTVPFRFKVAANTPINEKLAIKFTFTDGTYSDYQYYEVVLNPDYLTIDINKLAVTITSTGNIGYKDLDPQMGNGVRYRKMNLLAEGGIMIGNSPTIVSDNIRFQAGTDTDFRSITRAHFINGSPRADMEAEGMMQDSFPQSSGTLGVNVNYRAYARQNTPNDKFVILEYRIINPQATTLTNVYAGMFTDWDIFDSNHNRAVWDAPNKMGYIYNVSFDTLYTAVKLLSSGVPSFYGIDNYSPAPGTINISDGFTNAEKFQALSGGVARASAGSPLVGNDVSFVIGEKLPDLQPNQSATLALAIIAGDDLADIQASAQAAQIMYTQRALGRNEDLAKSNLKIFPNPAQNLLTIQLQNSNENIETFIAIQDALGRDVVAPMVKKTNKFELDVSALAGGLYVLKVSNRDSVQTFKVQIVK